MDTPGRIAELERKFAENPRRYFAALANEFRKQGDLDHAIEMCEAHLAEQRNHLSGHVVLAQALVDAGRESDAWDPLHTALDLDPENFIALRLIGELFARVGDQDQARTYFFRALEIEPRNDQLLAAVKNLSQRPAPTPEPGEAAQPGAVASQTGAPPSWGDVTLLQGLDSSIAFEAESAAEPVAEEIAFEAAGGEPQPEPVSEQFSDELPFLEPPQTDRGESPAAEPGAGAAAAGEEPADKPLESASAQSADSAFADWLPVPGGAAAPTPGEDWVSAAGPVPDEGAGDWDAAPPAEEPKPAPAGRYDHHDWLPALETDTDQAGADESVASVAETAQRAERPESAERVEPTEPIEPVWPVEPVEAIEPIEPIEPDRPAEPAGFTEPTPDEPRPALASETMVDLYLQQGHVSLAVDVLRELVGTRPDDERLRERLAELEVQAAAPPRQTVRDMFARFARTSQPLRRRAHPDAAGDGTDGVGSPHSGPLADFFAGVPGAVGGRRTPPDALLAMLAPPEPAPTDEDALGRWLGAQRGS